MKKNIKDVEVIQDDKQYKDDSDEKVPDGGDLPEEYVVVVPPLVVEAEPVFTNKKYPKSEIVQQFDFSEVKSISAKSFDPKMIHKHYEKFAYEPEKIKKRWDKFKHSVEKNVTNDVKKIGPKEFYDIFQIMDIFYFGGAFEYILNKYGAKVEFIAERGLPNIFKGNNRYTGGFTWHMWKYPGDDFKKGVIAMNMHIMDNLFKDPNIDFYYIGSTKDSENLLKGYDAMECMLHTFCHECVHMFNNIFTQNQLNMDKNDRPSLKPTYIKAERKNGGHGPLFMKMVKHLFGQTSKYHSLTKPLVSDKGKENIISDFKKKFKIGDILQHNAIGKVREQKKEILAFDFNKDGDEIVKIRDLSDKIRKKYSNKIVYENGQRKIVKYCWNENVAGKYREYWVKIVDLALLL